MLKSSWITYLMALRALKVTLIYGLDNQDFKSVISHLSTADISTPAELLVPNLNVISSGCFFLDVIFTTEFRACLDWM